MQTGRYIYICGYARIRCDLNYRACAHGRIYIYIYIGTGHMGTYRVLLYYILYV